MSFSFSNAGKKKDGGARPYHNPMLRLECSLEYPPVMVLFI